MSVPHTMATATSTTSPAGADAVGGGAVAPPQKGYPLEIFQQKRDQDKFSCGFCARILRDPVQADCGHRFCENCRKAIEASCRAGDNVLCRFCQEEGCSEEQSKLDPDRMNPDRGIKREMGNIIAKCPNQMCIYSGPFKEYIKHEEECKFKPVICDKCGEPVWKQKLDHHKNRDCPQRVIKCEHCQGEIPFAEKTSHLKECPKVLENCSQCNKQIPREKMERHQSSDCPNRMVVCPLEECSPSSQVLSRFQQHVQKETPKHLAWVVSRMADLDAAVSQLTEPPAASSIPGATGGAPPLSMAETLAALDERLGGMEQRLQERLRAAAAESSGGGGGGGGATGGAAVASGGAEATASTSGGSHDERINAMELKVNTLEPILSVLHGEMNRCISAIEEVEVRLRQERTRTQVCEEKMDQYQTSITGFSTSQAQQESKLRELEAQCLTVSQASPDGTLLWKIPNFSQVRQNAMSGRVTSIYSRPFCTGPIGYKIMLRLYPNGDGAGKGTHMSLFMAIMRSPNDALMPWPFKQSVYFMLIDQNFKNHVVDAFKPEPASSSSFQRPTSEMNIATGVPLFMPLSKFHQPDRDYLKNDTLFIRAVVNTEGLDDHVKQFDPRNVPLANSGSNTS